MKKILQILKKTYISWDKHDPWAQSAIIAYYALFSLPSLLMITMYIAGSFFGREAVQGRITQEIGSLIGSNTATAIEDMIASAALESSSAITIIVGMGMLIFGATGVFYQLQRTLNAIWNVRAKEEGFVLIVKKRIISFGMVLAIGLLLLISLLLSAVINAFSNWLGNYYSGISEILVSILNFILSEGVIAMLFVAIFTILPDVKIPWRTTFIGAAITALLFLIGKYALGFYFSASNPASVYGAAGSVVLILLWVYYTCIILFFGAEFTYNWALLHQVKIVPSENAVPSYQKELEELREFKKKVEQNKREADELANN